MHFEHLAGADYECSQLPLIPHHLQNLVMFIFLRYPEHVLRIAALGTGCASSAPEAGVNGAGNLI